MIPTTKRGVEECEERAEQEWGADLCRWNEAEQEWYASETGDGGEWYATGCTDRRGGDHRPIDELEEPVPLSRLAQAGNLGVYAFVVLHGWDTESIERG